MTIKDRVYSFEELKAKIGNKEKITLTGNTIAFMKSSEPDIDLFRKDICVIQLYNTQIIRIYPNNTYKIITNGFDTNTTLGRIRGFSPAKLWKVKGNVVINTWIEGKQQNIDFKDGMTVNEYGELI